MYHDDYETTVGVLTEVTTDLIAELPGAFPFFQDSKVGCILMHLFDYEAGRCIKMHPTVLVGGAEASCSSPTRGEATTRSGPRWACAARCRMRGW